MTKSEADVNVIGVENLVKEESYHLGPNSNVFQAKTFAVGETARVLRETDTAGKSIVMNCDSQATSMSVINTQNKSKTTWTTVSELNNLG